MKENLKTKLKEMGLLPLEIDKEAQDQYRKQGIDPSIVETHYNPGTPKHIINFYISLNDKILKLNKIETSGKVDSLEYGQLEKSIREDLEKVPEILKKSPRHRPLPGAIPLN